MNITHNHSHKLIQSECELRKIIPNYPKILDKRIIHSLDHYCLEIIEHASLLVFGSNDSQNQIDILSRSSFEVMNSKTIHLDLGDYIQSSNERTHASLYFLVPGEGHGLRVNGTIHQNKLKTSLSITGAYVHCARAAARSELWRTHEAAPLATCNSSIKNFLKESSFLMLKTMNLTNQTELSPRGDQAGFIQMINSTSLFIPERPGNKVAVSLRNIMQNEAVELLLIIPGSNLVMKVNGKASLTNEAVLLDTATVNHKRPKLGIRVKDCHFNIHHNAALAMSKPWQASTQISDNKLTKFSKVLSKHINGEGLLAKASTPIVQAIVKHDMKNLY